MCIAFAIVKCVRRADIWWPINSPFACILHMYLDVADVKFFKWGIKSENNWSGLADRNTSTWTCRWFAIFTTFAIDPRLKYTYLSDALMKRATRRRRAAPRHDIKRVLNVNWVSSSEKFDGGRNWTSRSDLSHSRTFYTVNNRHYTHIHIWIIGGTCSHHDENFSKCFKSFLTLQRNAFFSPCILLNIRVNAFLSHSASRQNYTGVQAKRLKVLKCMLGARELLRPLHSS